MAGAAFQTDGEVLMSETMDGGVPTLPFGDVEDEIDLAISDIREPVLWERSYSSTNLSSGILGRGWSVLFEGRLYQEESGRLHVKIPNGALVFFEWKGAGYQEIGKIKGRYGLKCDPVKMVWSLIDYHTHQIMQYDEKGRLSALCDRNNQQTMLFYQNGQLDHIITSLGHQLHFEFSGNKLIKVSDETGRTVKYSYDGDMLTEVTNTAGGRFLYEYSEVGKLTKATDPTGLTYLNNQYDDNGRVCSQVLWDGDACRLEYGDSGDETTKGRFSFRLTAPYSAERRKAASEMAKKENPFATFL